MNNFRVILKLILLENSLNDIVVRNNIIFLEYPNQREGLMLGIYTNGAEFLQFSITDT